MSAPRQILPATTYLITRRCAHRQFFLRPSAETNGLFLYVLAVTARRFHIHVHAFCVLSNHLHIVLTDPDARLPAFEQYLDSLVARALNARLARSESLWDPTGYSAVVPSSRVDVVDKAAYALANPVAAGLVQRGREWPGLWSAPEQIGAARSPRGGLTSSFDARASAAFCSRVASAAVSRSRNSAAEPNPLAQLAHGGAVAAKELGEPRERLDAFPLVSRPAFSANRGANAQKDASRLVQ